MKFFEKKNKKRSKNIKYPKYLQKLDENNFDGFLEKYPLCFIDFWASWCSPCKKMDPRIRRISKIFEKKVAFGKVNIKENKIIAEKYKIMSIPTFILFKNGKKKAVLTGLKSVGSIKKIIKKYL